MRCLYCGTRAVDIPSAALVAGVRPDQVRCCANFGPELVENEFGAIAYDDNGDAVLT